MACVRNDRHIDQKFLANKLFTGYDMSPANSDLPKLLTPHIFKFGLFLLKPRENPCTVYPPKVTQSLNVLAFPFEILPAVSGK